MENPVLNLNFVNPEDPDFSESKSLNESRNIPYFMKKSK